MSEMKFEIKVVEHEDEKLFQTAEGGHTILFNKLVGIEHYIGGKLEIVRDGKAIEESLSIHSCRESSDGVCFDMDTEFPTEFLAEDYEEGDIFKLAYPSSNPADTLVSLVSDHFRIRVQLPEISIDTNPMVALASVKRKPLPSVLRYK